MTLPEFREWYAFHQRNPIDDYSLHIRPAALIAHTVAASQAGDKAPSFDKFLQHLAPTPEEDEGPNLFEQLKRRAQRDIPAPG
jgi:hypothetical protein